MTEFKLDIYEFGNQLLDTQDLDPVYVLLWESELDEEHLKRWLLAYWCFYHVGTASWISDKDFWSRMEFAAKSKHYPRCTERRHFRGENAEKSVKYLKSRGIDDLFSGLLSDYEIPMKQITDEVRKWVGFGPWIAFKVADMLERLNLVSVIFDVSDVLYDSPLEGAKTFWERENGEDPPDSVGSWAIGRILRRLGHRLSPPGNERRINPQEAETILCKWNSYVSGHYKIGEDVEGCQEGLNHFIDQSETARRLYLGGQKGGLW